MSDRKEIDDGDIGKQQMTEMREAKIGVESMKPNEPRLMLFDCDGTLMDSHHHIIVVMQQAFSDNALPEPSASDVCPVIGLSLALAVQHLLPDSDEQVQAAVEQRYRDLYQSLPAAYDLFAGVRETLVELRHRGYWLGVVTGKSHAGLQRVLKKFDLAHHFLVLRTPDHCASKPHPAMVLECMAEMGVEAAQTAVVGDALLDIQMARAAGVRSFGVSFGVAGGGALLAAGAEAVIDDFAELLAHFPPLQSGQPLATIRP